MPKVGKFLLGAFNSPANARNKYTMISFQFASKMRTNYNESKVFNERG